MSVESSVSFTATGGTTTFSGISSLATGTSGNTIIVSVPATTTDQLYPITIDVSEIESLFLYTNGALTLQTNDGTTPDQTFTFVASKPLVWVSGMPVACPLTIDVTEFYLTNAGSSAVTLYGFINQSL